ncbi:MAG: dihydrolipoyllysine-residue succinyltransferase [Betaproteobacteria bacterium]|nr:dihydrolipoyllysine-residue succinyltransferase [Betaproteobacteria bacterium]
MDILMPQLGETVAEGTVTNWYKKIGESVRADEALFDVETDKVATEIPCPVAGVLAEVLVPAGTTVKVGTRLAVVRSAGEQVAAAGPTRENTDVRRSVAAAQAEARSPASLLDSRVRGNDNAQYPDAGTAPSIAAERDSQQKLSPVVRRLLAEHGLDAAAIRGSGRDGRVTRDDVQAFLAHRAPAMQPASSAEAAVPFVVARGPGAAAAEPMPMPAPVPASRLVPGSPLPPGERPGVREIEPATAEYAASRVAQAGEVIVPLNNIRRRSAAAMTRAWQVVPHVLQAVEADYSRIEQARRARQAAWQAREGFELTYLPFLAWAVCQALQRYEQLNARIDGDNLVVSRRVQLGIAVDLNHEGLVVPVIRDAQDRNVPALAREIRRLALAARGNKLKPDDLSQPTYTISNSGVFGTLITAPIVNPPQVAILSTDGVSKRPVVVEAPEGDSIAVRPVGVLAQSFDHRAVDGAYSAAFLKELKRIVETRMWIDDVV